jgi:hypothetical protein
MLKGGIEPPVEFSVRRWRVLIEAMQERVTLIMRSEPR